jgi:hypothetical protein
MVVTSVRDYLRKMSEGVDKPPPAPRGPVRRSSPGVHDSSTVRNPHQVYHLLMLVWPRSGQVSLQWVNYSGQHNSKRGMNQRGYPDSAQLRMGRIKGVNNKKIDANNNDSMTFPQTQSSPQPAVLDHGVAGDILRHTSSDREE